MAFMSLEEQIIEIEKEISSLIKEQDSLLKNFKLEFPKSISYSLVGLRLKELGIETYYNSLE